jgi:glycosyltransferase involved in cell wall biosynthesis
MKPSFTYTGQPGEGYGWGTANTYLSRELRKLFPEEGLDVVMQPLADHNLTPSSCLRGGINLGYSFFESELGPPAAANAAQFDIVFVGSTWCLDRLKERGITNGQVLLQGVDQSIFYPRPRKPDGQFRIFSGGKFEYRKGQDLVIAAFREFSRSHPEAHLVCSWFNPWPGLITSDLWRMNIKTHVRAETQWEFFKSLLVINDIDPSRFTILGMLDHIDLAEQMAQTDVGLFPNRCEGGTNLVLMEYAAIGRGVIANPLTGHRDVKRLITQEIPATEDANKWAIQDPLDIPNMLELETHWVGELEPSIPTWRQSAETVANAIARLPVAV